MRRRLCSVFCPKITFNEFNFHSLASTVCSFEHTVPSSCAALTRRSSWATSSVPKTFLWRKVMASKWFFVLWRRIVGVVSEGGWRTRWLTVMAFPWNVEKGDEKMMRLQLRWIIAPWISKSSAKAPLFSALECHWLISEEKVSEEEREEVVGYRELIALRRRDMVFSVGRGARSIAAAAHFFLKLSQLSWCR